jgi:hypothetical protein
MIYSHIVCLIVWVMIYTFLSDVIINEIVLPNCQIIIFSADTFCFEIVMIVIYFAPKFLAPDKPNQKATFTKF